jgi:NAD(P)-dependent dehydrogenase (short-subunit alcohol dehydrogenase family)
MNFSAKAVLVTGAGSGIGRATALAFAAAGARVAAADISQDSAEQTAAMIAQSGGISLAITADTSRANRHRLRPAGHRLQQCRHQRRPARPG